MANQPPSMPPVPPPKLVAPPPVAVAAAKAGAPLPPGVKAPAAQPQAIVADYLPQEEYFGPPLSFWQQPWVQNILPFVTSLSVHAAILIIGLLVFGVVKLATDPPKEDQVIIPDSNMVDNGPPGGIPNIGLGGDPLRQAAQDKDPTTDTKGWADKKGPSVDPNPSGATGDQASVFDSGAMGNIGGGHGNNGSGSGDGAGALAMFGTPGGGGIGPKGPVFGAGGNARMIVFLCDATGSMINKMATLKDELNKAIVGLRPVQSFDIIFYQDIKVEPMAASLIAANPENKRKAAVYLDGVTSTGTTDPIPALTAALKLKPQLMYFLTDAADFPDTQAVLDTIKKYNPDRRIKINTILLVENKAEHEKNADSEGLMKKIAADSGGNFRWVEIDAIQ